MAYGGLPVFAMGKSKNIAPSISSGKLTYPAFICCTDTDTVAFLDGDYSLHDVKGYGQASIKRVDELPEAGDEDTFYICGGVGYIYIGSVPVPLFRDISEEVSYDALTDTPITNEKGTAGAEVVLAELPDGTYSVSGGYRIKSDGTVYLTADKTLFTVETDSENEGVRYVTKFGSSSVIRYTVYLDGAYAGSDGRDVVEDAYATESWVQGQEYLSGNDIGAISDETIKKLFE